LTQLEVKAVVLLDMEQIHEFIEEASSVLLGIATASLIVSLSGDFLKSLFLQNQTDVMCRYESGRVAGVIF
jgi:hypothetical protein